MDFLTSEEKIWQDGNTCWCVITLVFAHHGSLIQWQLYEAHHCWPHLHCFAPFTVVALGFVVWNFSLYWHTGQNEKWTNWLAPQQWKVISRNVCFAKFSYIPCIQSYWSTFIASLKKHVITHITFNICFFFRYVHYIRWCSTILFKFTFKHIYLLGFVTFSY